MNKKNIDYKRLAIFVIVIGIFLRFALASIYTVSGDACWQLSASRFIAENRAFPLSENIGRQEPFWPPPLFHIMAALMYSIFGVFGFAEFGMKMLSPLLGSLTLIIAYKINKKLFSEKITFYSMLFTVFLPFFIDYHIFGYIDGAVTFFAVLGIYFALDGRYIKSAISAGLCAITKYNGIFIVPALVYITYKKSKDKSLFFKRIMIMLLVMSATALPWLVRNYANFGNPFWPFMNFIFKGMDTSAFESADVQNFSLARILHPNSLIFTYLALFGVPDGNYQAIFFFGIPHVKFLFVIWLLATLFFILPFAKSLRIKDKTTKGILLAWILPFAAVLALYIGNANWTAARFFMPAIPALGILYGVGLSSVNFKNNNLKRIFFVSILIIIFGFIAAESAKIALASKEWNKYKEDFKWIEGNTEKGALLMPGAQCLAYHAKRGTLKQSIKNIENADYIFVNRNFKLERRSIVSDEFLEEVKKRKYGIVYENNETGTSIHKVK